MMRYCTNNIKIRTYGNEMIQENSMDSYVSPAELAKHEDISISLIRRLMREGVLEFIEYSPKVRKIPMRAWEAYKQQQTKNLR